MADIVNLRRFRKQKKRAAKEQQAEENRVRFGRTKVEKSQGDFARTRLNSHLEGHRHNHEDD